MGKLVAVERLEVAAYGEETAENYAQEVISALHEGTEAFIKAGESLLRAKTNLPHGEFCRMVETLLPFTRQTAFRLMKISSHDVLSNVTHVQHLPPSWGTLYELTKVPLSILEAALEDGRINPGMERKDVRALLPGDDPLEPECETCEVKDLEQLIASGRTFGTIYADPPWQYGNQGTRAATDNHYETMAVEEIADLPIKALAAENAHLHLWTTNAFLFDAKKIIEAWGFEYKSVMVWVKPQMGIGNYWRVSHEFLLLGVRGKSPFLNRGQMSWIQTERLQHSEKPEIFRRTVELVSPGPRIELFGRRISDGWTVWGNEIVRTMFDVNVATVGGGVAGERIQSNE